MRLNRCQTSFKILFPLFVQLFVILTTKECITIKAKQESSLRDRKIVVFLHTVISLAMSTKICFNKNAKCKYLYRHLYKWRSMYLRFVLSVHIQCRAEEKTSHYNHCILGVQCIEYFFLPLSIICGTVLQFSNLLKIRGVMGCRCFVWFHYFYCKSQLERLA